MSAATLELIQAIQRALRVRFGTEVKTDTGRSTLTIAHDHVELTDQNGVVIADDWVGAIGKLTGFPSWDENITVTLDALATKMVRWYADEYGREVADVANGVLAGSIEHLYEQKENDDLVDDTAEHLGWYLVAAIQRRKQLSKVG